MARNDNHLEGILGSTTMENHDIPTPPKITFDAIKQAFLAQTWNYFHLT